MFGISSIVLQIKRVFFVFFLEDLASGFLVVLLPVVTKTYLSWGAKVFVWAGICGNQSSLDAHDVDDMNAGAGAVVATTMPEVTFNL
jgi:hypothetical protein